MNMLKLNLAVVGVVVALTGAFAFGLLLPGAKELDDCHERLGVDQNIVQEKQKQVGDVSHLYASIMEMNEATRDYREKLPADRRFGQFLSDLSAMLRAAQIGDYVVQPRSAMEVDPQKLPASLKLSAGTTILPVNISFEGSFSQVFEFLKGLESMKRVMHVESLRLTNDEDEPGHVAVEMMLHTYRHAG